MNEFHLLIDDFREFDVDHIAKTAQDGRQALLSFPVTHLYMDHDLVGRDNMAATLEHAGYEKKGNWYVQGIISGISS
jgi:hypothetical protein